MKSTRILRWARKNRKALVKAYTFTPKIFFAFNPVDISGDEAFSFLNPAYAPKISENAGQLSLSIPRHLGVGNLMKALDGAGVSYRVTITENVTTASIDTIRPVAFKVAKALSELYKTEFLFKGEDAIEANLDFGFFNIVRGFEERKDTVENFELLIKNISEYQKINGLDPWIAQIRVSRLNKMDLISGYTGKSGYHGTGLYLTNRSEVSLIRVEDPMIDGEQFNGEGCIVISSNKKIQFMPKDEVCNLWIDDYGFIKNDYFNRMKVEKDPQKGLFS